MVRAGSPRSSPGARSARHGPRQKAAILAAALVTLGVACREADRPIVAALRVDGVRAVDEARLREVLATRESSPLPWGRKHIFDRATFEADLARVVAFYADRGYPHARVVATDVRVDPDGRRVRLRIVVAEGAPVLVERVGLEGFDLLPPRRQAALERALPLKAGRPHDRALARAATELAAGALAETGYPFATVAAVERPGSRADLVEIVLRAVSGEAAVFGPIAVAGHRRVDDGVIRRMLAYRPGEPFRLSALRETERRLARIELFERVEVRPLPTTTPAGVPTQITVVEGKLQRVGVDAGYGTEEQLRAELTWHHRNALGGARALRLRGKWSSIDRGIGFDVRQPYLFHPAWRLEVAGRHWVDDEPTFERASLGSHVAASREAVSRDPLGRPRAVTTLAVLLTSGRERLELPEAARRTAAPEDLILLGLGAPGGRRDGWRSALALEWERAAAAGADGPTRRVSLHLEQAGWWVGGDFRYVELAGAWQQTVPLGRRTVLATRLRAGTVDGPEPVPIFKRYFLGGSTSLRGWGRFEVAPSSAAGLPLGGQTMLEGSAELRVRRLGPLGAVLFLDGGNAWPRAWQARLTDLRYAAGAGLRVPSPLGPVRVDVGYQLTPVAGFRVGGAPGPRRWRLHVGLGEAF